MSECIDDVIYPSSSAMKMIRLSKTAAANTSSTCWSVRQLKSMAKLTCSSQESSGRVRLMIWWKVTTVTNMSTVVPACHHSTDRALLFSSFYITVSLYLFFFHFKKLPIKMSLQSQRTMLSPTLRSGHKNDHHQ